MTEEVAQHAGEIVTGNTKAATPLLPSTTDALLMAIWEAHRAPGEQEKFVVVTNTLQPLEIALTELMWLFTNSCHCPPGLIPLKTAKLVAYGALGAGNGNELVVEVEVGWYTPFVIVAVNGTNDEDESSNVTDCPVKDPPTPDISKTAVFEGPTSKRSM